MTRKSSLYELSGTEDIVRTIQKRFVNYFRNNGPVLDIGCGRGIFLELLAGAGIEAIGVDRSKESVHLCKQGGWRVEQDDACEYLRRVPDRFGGIFCSHLIEHMPYEDALLLLRLCYAALRPNGVLVVVTPNPEDLAVISEIFWLDPTHIRPYPRLLLKQMLDSVGFAIKKDYQFLGTWRVVGRRSLLAHAFRRLVLGKYFGKQNTFVLAQKELD